MQCLGRAVGTASWRRLPPPRRHWRLFVGVILVSTDQSPQTKTFCFFCCSCFSQNISTKKRKLQCNQKSVMPLCLPIIFPVVKLRLTRLRNSPASLSQFSLAAKLDVLNRGSLLGGQIRSRIELWLERDATCVRNMTRKHPRGGTFLVTGTVQGEHLVVNKAYAWQRQDRSLTAAVRKWKSHRCRN